MSSRVRPRPSGSPARDSNGSPTKIAKMSSASSATRRRRTSSYSEASTPLFSLDHAVRLSVIATIAVLGYMVVSYLDTPMADDLAGMQRRALEQQQSDSNAASNLYSGASNLGNGNGRRDRRAPIDPSTFSSSQVYSTSVIAPWYKCDPAACVLPDCQCAATRPPAGLDPASVPQFVTITVDDAVNAQVQDPPLSAVDSVVANPGDKTSCPARLTYFASAQWTDFRALQILDALGNEIAAHTWDQASPATADDVFSALQAFDVFAQVPAVTFVGFRAPNLKFDLAELATLRALGLSYDASMTVMPNGTNTVWPFTFDAGLPVSCASGNCTGAAPPSDEVVAGKKPAWKVKGLWELPIYTIPDPETAGVGWAVDPPVDGNTYYAMLMNAYQDHYNGNRAPFGVHVHAAWLLDDPSRAVAIHKFLKDITTTETSAAQAQTYPATRIVTNKQLLTWLRSPTPLSSYVTVCPPAAVSVDVSSCPGTGAPPASCSYGSATFKTCARCPVSNPTSSTPVPPLSGAAPAGSPCEPPTGGCGFGSFDASKCACVCVAPTGTEACPVNSGLGQCDAFPYPDPKTPGAYLSCADSVAAIKADRDVVAEKVKASSTSTGGGSPTATTPSGSQFNAIKGSTGGKASGALVSATVPNLVVLLAAVLMAVGAVGGMTM